MVGSKENVIFDRILPLKPPLSSPLPPEGGRRKERGGRFWFIFYSKQLWLKRKNLNFETFLPGFFFQLNFFYKKCPDQIFFQNCAEHPI